MSPIMPGTERPVWRSLLYVPADNERFLAKAGERGADAIILDLEDSIAPHRKAAARQRCTSAIAELAPARADLLVRINRPLRLAVADLEAVVQPGLAALLLPKCDSAGQVQLLSEMVLELEAERDLPPGGVRFYLMIESAAAYRMMDHIARADPRCAAMSLGGEDFAAELGLEPNAETLAVPKQQALIAAVAAGLTPLGLLGTVADYRDLAAVEETARRSARFGFEGASCIHPAVVEALNRGFTPSAEAVARAREIVASLGEAEARGIGAISHRGRMVDAPVADRARRLIARADAICARER